MRALHELGAVEAAALIASGDLTSTALTSHLLDRIDRLDPALGAYVTVTADLALEQAAAADAAVRAGEPLGGLHGVPVAVKDNLDVEDVVSSWGSVAREDEATGDDHVVARLRAAQMPILGKTQLPEFALPCYTENGIGADTRNPWSELATPGGSSGGSAAAVAAGLAPIALGTDAGGSVRTPASCCGLVGIRPSNGMVSPGPADQAPTGLSSPGVIGRSVVDTRALLAVICGNGPGDLTTVRPPRQASSRLTVGVTTAPMVPDLTVHPACEEAVADTADALAALGHEVTEIDLGLDVEISAAFRDAWSVVAASFEVDDEDVLMPFTTMMREHGRGVSGVGLHRALTMFRGVSLMLESFLFGAVDVLLTPTLATPPPPRGAFRGPDELDNFDRMTAFMPFTPMYNIAGMPSLTLPVAVSDGLPIGVMIGAPHGGDDLLLSLAESLLPSPGADLAPGWAER